MNKHVIKHQSKLTFKGIKNSFENCDSYTFKQNKVLEDKPFNLGFTVLDLSKLHLYETYFDKLQPFFGQDKFQLHCIDCDSFVLSLETQIIFNDLKILERFFDFSNLKNEWKSGIIQE